MAALPAGAWPNWVLGNHDKPRIVSRIGVKKARAAALLLFSLPGTLTVYYGEEIGMQDVQIPADEVHDPAEKRQPGIGMGRDPERTPMPWDSSSLYCGFTTGAPWLPIGANRDVNVKMSERARDSMLLLYKRLLRLRRAERVLVSGKLEELSSRDGVLRFTRTDETERFTLLINFAEEVRTLEIDRGVIAACTDLEREGERVNAAIHLDPSEAVIVRAEK